MNVESKIHGNERSGRVGEKGGGAREGSGSAAKNPDLVQTDGKAAGKERKHICIREMEVDTECRKSFGAAQR